jgi:GTP-binding protein
LKIQSAEFVTSALSLAACPQSTLPEFAFIGRSNVGKSSLVNLLTGKRDLARVSATPGKTDLLNFFLINRSWLLVDLPGYGFAKASRSKRDNFQNAVDDYVESRENLRCLFVLIDSRLPPQPIDLQFIRWVHHLSRPFALVFTKTDKQSAPATQRAIELVLAEVENLTRSRPEYFTSSSITQKGRSEILSAIERMCTEGKAGLL